MDLWPLSRPSNTRIRAICCKSKSFYTNSRSRSWTNRLSRTCLSVSQWNRTFTSSTPRLEPLEIQLANPRELRCRTTRTSSSSSSRTTSWSLRMCSSCWTYSCKPVPLSTLRTWSESSKSSSRTTTLEPQPKVTVSKAWLVWLFCFFRYQNFPGRWRWWGRRWWSYRRDGYGSEWRHRHGQPAL